VSIARLATVLMVASSLAVGLVGCSRGDRDNPDAWYNKTVIENFAGRSNPQPDPRTQQPLLTDSAAAPMGTVQSGTVQPGMVQPSIAQPGSMQPGITQPGVVQPAALQAGGVLPTELYRSESSCGSMVSGPGSAGLASEIALDMTECDVARRAGVPDKVELAAMPNGARALTLSYLRSARPHVYHFASGRLYSIENLPESARGKPSQSSLSARPARY